MNKNSLKTFSHRGRFCWIEEGKYENGRLAIQVWSEEGPEATLTVNLPDEPLNKDEFFVRVSEENEEVAKSAMRSGFFSDTGRRVRAGFIEVQVWKYRDARKSADYLLRDHV